LTKFGSLTLMLLET